MSNVSLNENQIRILYQSIEKIHELKDWEQLTQAIVMDSVGLTGGQKGIFLVFDHSMKELIPQASCGMDKSEIKKYIATATELFLDEENQIKRSLHIEGDYYFPITIQQKFAGVLIIALAETEALLPEQLNLMYFFMQSVPIILENSRLYLMMQRKTKSLTYMNQLHQVINQYSFQEILAEVVLRIGDFLHSEMAGIMLYDPDKNELCLQKPAFGYWQESIIGQYRVKLTEKSNAKNVFLTGISSLAVDATTDERFNQFFVDLFKAKTIITVPLVVDHKRIGIIHAINKKEGYFTQEDLNLLEEIASQLGAIFHAGLQMNTIGKMDYRRLEIERYLKTQLIECLMSNEPDKLEEAANILNTLQLSLEPKHCFLSIGVFGDSGWEKKIVIEYFEPMVREVEKYLPKSLFYNDDGILLVLSSQKEVTDLLQTAVLLQQKINEMVHDFYQSKRLKVYIGIGELVTSVLETGNSLQQSKQILQVLPQTEQIGLVGYFPICGNWTLLSSLTMQRQLASSFVNFFLKEINELRDAQEIKKTLEMFLKYNGHMKQTAEALFIHQNTLKYRIEKIEDITDFDLADSELRFNLNLALRLEQLLSS